ncbi:hypothetical protein WK25_23580 [Burkholderia latens]|nr:hypothetical protein WK25_23580 [Burkholderia latens]
MRANRDASGTIDDYGRDIPAMIANAGDLAPIPSIGADFAAKLCTLAEPQPQPLPARTMGASGTSTTARRICPSAA